MSKEGVSVRDVVKCAEELGYRTLVYQTSYKYLYEKAPLPCIIYLNAIQHFVVLYKITKKKVYISDPKMGLVTHTKQDFVKQWLGGINEKDAWRKGVVILLEPTRVFKDKESKQVNKVHYIEYLLSFIKPYKKQVFQLFFILFIATAINAVLPIIVQSIIDIGIPAKDISFITLLIVANLVLVISSNFGTWIRAALTMHLATRIKVSMLSDYLLRLFKLPLTYFENKLMGDVIQRTNDFSRIESFIMNASFSAVLALLYLLVFGTVLFMYSSLLFWIYLVSSILYIVWVLVFWEIRKKMDIRYFEYMAQNNSIWIELLTKILDIKSYSFGRGIRGMWERVQTNLYKTQVKLLKVDQVQQFGSNFINAIKDILLIFVSARSVMMGDMSMGMMIAVQYILGQLKTPLNDIVLFITSSQLAYISFNRATDIQKIASEEKEYENPIELVDFSKDIFLKNVYYSYNKNDNPALKNINLVIPRGKTIAIVGESGCGKSTLLKLLAQLYTPNSGEILLGDINIASINIEEWRKKCGILMQESTIFKDTVLNNITIGKEFDSKLFFESVEVANIRKEVEKLSAGFNTLMGENGRGLSEGQKQRVLLARAIYQKPNYVFLDEITSVLDSANELKILEGIKQYLQDSTVVIAAHRLSTVRNADVIIVLKEGQVCEVGIHQLLSQKKGYYYQLFLHQITENS
jgi:ATP-binding cassette subfamily B protein